MIFFSPATLFPYVVLTIMLGYVATLEGFKDGVEYYIVPDDWGKMLEIEVWVSKICQKIPIFFT